jgi:hypothetical protein
LTFESYPEFARERGEPELIEVVRKMLAGGASRSVERAIS